MTGSYSKNECRSYHVHQLGDSLIRETFRYSMGSLQSNALMFQTCQLSKLMISKSRSFSNESKICFGPLLLPLSDTQKYLGLASTSSLFSSLTTSSATESKTLQNYSQSVFDMYLPPEGKSCRKRLVSPLVFLGSVIFFCLTSSKNSSTFSHLSKSFSERNWTSVPIFAYCRCC